jgi:hypothetical protein
MSITTLILWALAGCTGDGRTNVEFQGGDEPTEDDPDEDGPVITHTPVETTQVLGEDVVIEATVVDEESGVLVVEVYYKEETSTEWSTGSGLSLQDDAGNYMGVIPGDKVRGGGMNYYLSAVDLSNNESWMPEEGDDDPYHFRVSE